ncbi:MAG TPA: hypothetical protein VGN26_10010 [Armatimonadota bacterium]|jgi:hypothetical protein
MILAVIPWSLLLLQAAVLGAGASRALFPRRLTQGERWLLFLALGLGLDAYLVLAAGLAGALTKGTLLLVLGLLTLAAAPIGGLSLIRETLALRKGGSWPHPDGWTLGCLALLALCCVAAVAPPAGLDWDGLSYHLAVPKVYLAHHRIYYVAYDHHSNFPFTVEMLFTLGLALGSPALAVLCHTAFAALGAAALGLFARRFGWRGGSLAAFMYLSCPMVLWEATVGYVDLGVALYLLLAVCGVLAARDAAAGDGGGEPGDRARWLLLSGVFAGLAVGCKTTAVIPVALLALGALAVPPGSVVAGRLKAAALYLVAAAVVACPWFLKSYAYTGNPVYPFLYSIFGGANWNAELARVYSLEQAGFGAGRSAADLLLLPWRLVVSPQFFSKGIGVYGSIGPLFLGLLPLAALCRTVDRRVAGLLALSAAVLVPWAFSSQQSRYLLPLFPLWCLACAWVLVDGGLGPRASKAGGLFVLACAALSVLAFARISVAPAAAVAFGAETRDDYLSRHLDLWPAARFINEQIPRSAEVLLFEETRGFYLDRGYLWANPGHSTLIPYDTFRTPAEMVEWFRARGYTHALMNARNARRGWGSSPWERLLVEAVREGRLQQVFSERGVQVLALRG